MKLGFLTACLPQRSLTDIAARAAANAWEALEVAAWPARGNRPFTAPVQALRPYVDRAALAQPKEIQVAPTGITGTAGPARPSSGNPLGRRLVALPCARPPPGRLGCRRRHPL